MKKIAFFGILVGVMATGSAFAETAFEGQAISSIPLTVGKSAMVAVAFKELSADVNQNVSVSNILSTVNLANGDQVYVYHSGGYQSWTFDGSKWIDNDSTFKKTADGDQENGKGAVSGEMRPAVGEGFWLVRQDSTPTTVYIYGAAVEKSSTTAIAQAKTLMGNPKMADATPTISGMAVGDQIGLFAADNKPLKRYSFGKDEKWYGQGRDSNGYVIAVEVEKITIPKGAGFWYNSRGSGNVSFTW